MVGNRRMSRLPDGETEVLTEHPFWRVSWDMRWTPGAKEPPRGLSARLRRNSQGAAPCIIQTRWPPTNTGPRAQGINTYMFFQWFTLHLIAFCGWGFMLKIFRTTSWPVWLSWLGVSLQRKIHQFDPSQGACLGCRFNPQLGRVWEATAQCYSPSPPLSFPFFLKINKHF